MHDSKNKYEEKLKRICTVILSTSSKLLSTSLWEFEFSKIEGDFTDKLDQCFLTLLWWQSRLVWQLQFTNKETDSSENGGKVVENHCPR